MNNTMSNQTNTRIVNHKSLRVMTGVIAILMPFVVQLLSGYKWELSSISVSYWTHAGDIFVGSIVAIAFFLAAYNGTGDCQKDTEYWISKLAGLLALMVALIPTDCTIYCKNGEVPFWVNNLTFGHHGLVHNIVAVLFFICLFILINFFARTAKYKEKIGRSRFYTIISLCMLFGMPLTYLLALGFGFEPIYWVEVVGLILFGIAWFVAGTYKTDERKEPSSSAQHLGDYKVNASIPNYPTKIIVEPGKRYLFKAHGCWKDAFLACGPTGWGPSWNWWTRKNRLKGSPIFMLCGNIGRNTVLDDIAFEIGYDKVWTAPKNLEVLSPDNQELYLFANDWNNKYQNNSGSVNVSIYKL